MVRKFLSRAGLYEAVAIDGKPLRGSGQDEHKPQQLMAVVTHKTPVTLAQRPVGDRTNELCEAASLLASLDCGARWSPRTRCTRKLGWRGFWSSIRARTMSWPKITSRYCAQGARCSRLGACPPVHGERKGHGRSERRTLQLPDEVGTAGSRTRRKVSASSAPPGTAKAAGDTRWHTA